jgi:hypothetical protein
VSSTLNSVTLIWTAISSGINSGYSEVTGYKVYLNDGTTGNAFSLAATLTGATTLTTTLTGLTPSINYSFKISALNIHGESVLSSGFNVMTINVPSQPNTPVVSLNGHLARFTWIAPDNRGAAITAYKLKIKDSSDSFTLFTGSCVNTGAVISSSTLVCDILFTTLTTDFGLVAGSSIIA